MIAENRYAEEQMSERIHHPTLHALVSRYCAAWNESDEGRRTQTLQDIWAKDGVYVDPTVQLSGLPALVAHIGAALARHPGSRIVMTSDVDAHHGMLRFGSLRVRRDGTMLPEGIELAKPALLRSKAQEERKSNVDRSEAIFPQTIQHRSIGCDTRGFEEAAVARALAR